MRLEKYHRIIEALLFASHKPIDQNTIDKLFPDEKISLSNVIEKLNDQYSKHNNAFEIKAIAGGYQIVTRAEYELYIKTVSGKNSKFRPSKAFIDTIAIIAYKQPVSRSKIEFIRGVDSSGVLKTLLTKDLIKISGRSNAPGRPLLYKTTQQFLEYIGINNLSDMPKINEIKQLVDARQQDQYQTEVFKK